MNDKDLYIKQLEQEVKALRTKVSSLEPETDTKTTNVPPSDPSKKILPRTLPYDRIFNEADFLMEDSAIEPTMIEIRSYLCKLNTLDETKPIALETEHKEYTIEDDKLHCQHCGTKRELMGNEVARTEVDFIPDRMKSRNFIRSVYICPKCRAEGHNIIKRAVVPSPVVKRSLASPAAAAYVICQKYLHFKSLLRQELAWKEYDVAISRETLANWISYTSTQWILPFYEYLKVNLLSRPLLLTAQTNPSIIKDADKYFKSEVCMRVYQTAFTDPKPLILFDCTTVKNGNTPKKFLKDFKGFLHVNTYEGYEQVTKIPLCVSWLYVRNLFKSAMIKHTTGSKTSDASIAYEYCVKIIDFEKTMDDKSCSEREQYRKDKILPVIDTFFDWLNKATFPKYSKLEKAIRYTLSQKENLKRYLTDGRCFISNEAAEKSLLPFIPTQNTSLWQLYDCPTDGRRIYMESISVYSLIETAKANGLDVLKYFIYLFEGLPSEGFRKNQSLFGKYLPWNEQVLYRCRDTTSPNDL